MKILTPELWLISALSGGNTAAAEESRELDLDLARRSALIINSIDGVLSVVANTQTGAAQHIGLIQELDLDPDNAAIWLGDAAEIDDVVYDTSRVFRQRQIGKVDTATGSYQGFGNPYKQNDWTDLTISERPVTTKNMRHNIRIDVEDAAIVSNYEGEIIVRYYIAELTLEELGYLNASRR